MPRRRVCDSCEALNLGKDQTTSHTGAERKEFFEMTSKGWPVISERGKVSVERCQVKDAKVLPHAKL